jgi:hypothetical protein
MLKSQYANVETWYRILCFRWHRPPSYVETKWNLNPTLLVVSCGDKYIGFGYCTEPREEAGVWAEKGLRCG